MSNAGDGVPTNGGLENSSGEGTNRIAGGVPDIPFPSSGGLRRRLISGTAGSLVIKSTFVALQLAVGVVLARSLGPEGLGVYSFTLAVVMVLAIPAQLGIPAYLVRMVAVYRAGNQLSQLKRIVSLSAMVVGGVSVLVAGLAYLAAGFWPAVPSEMPMEPLLYGLVLIPLLAVTAVNQGALKGLGHVLVAQLPGETVRPAVLLLSVILLAGFVVVLTPQHALVANIIATVIALFLSVWALKKRLPRGAAHPTVGVGTHELLRGALPFLLLAGVQTMNYYGGLIMLGIMSTPEEVGLYRSAAQIADGLGIGLLAITAVIAPTLAALHSTGDWRRIRKLLVTSHRVGLVMLLPIAIGLAVYGSAVLGIVYGNEFTGAADALAILVVGKAMYAAVGFGGVALSMFGRAGKATLATAASGLLNIGLNFALIPRMGISGPATAAAVSEFLLCVACLYWVYHLYGHDVSALGLRKNRASAKNAR